MKNKLFAISTALLMVLSLAACSPVVEKEQPKTPGEMIAEQTPISMETEGAEISEEYEDEAVALATYSINTLYTKNEEFTNEKRREAIQDIAHPLFTEEIEKLHVQVDAVPNTELINLTIGKTYLLSGFTMTSIPKLEKQSAFRVDFKVDYEISGKTQTDEAHVILLVDNGILKFASFYGNE